MNDQKYISPLAATEMMPAVSPPLTHKSLINFIELNTDAWKVLPSTFKERMTEFPGEFFLETYDAKMTPDIIYNGIRLRFHRGTAANATDYHWRLNSLIIKR